MKHVFLIVALMSLAGCDSGPKWEPDAGSPQSVIIEQAVRVSLEKPDGNLTKEDLEKVTSLNLAHTQVTDAGLKELVNLRQLKALQLQDTQVTNAGVVELQKALPKCKITHNAKE